MSDKQLSPLAQARLDYPFAFQHVAEHYSQWPRSSVRALCPPPDYKHGKECRWQEMPAIVVPWCVYGTEPSHLRIGLWGHESPDLCQFSHESREYINGLIFRFVKAAWEFPRTVNWMRKLFMMLDAQECRNKKEVA